MLLKEPSRDDWLSFKVFLPRLDSIESVRFSDTSWMFRSDPDRFDAKIPFLGEAKGGHLCGCCQAGACRPADGCVKYGAAMACGTSGCMLSMGMDLMGVFWAIGVCASDETTLVCASRENLVTDPRLFGRG
jgi:hypothetical protein